MYVNFQFGERIKRQLSRITLSVSFELSLVELCLNFDVSAMSSAMKIFVSVLSVSLLVSNQKKKNAKS